MFVSCVTLMVRDLLANFQQTTLYTLINAIVTSIRVHYRRIQDMRELIKSIGTRRGLYVKFKLIFLKYSVCFGFS